MTTTRSRKPNSGEGMARRGRNTESAAEGRPNGKEKELCKTALTKALQQAYPSVVGGSYSGDGVIVVGVSPCMGCVVSAGKIDEKDTSTGLFYKQFNGRGIDSYVEEMLRTRGLDQYAISGECSLSVLMVSPDRTKYRTETLAWSDLPSIPQRMKSSYRDATKIKG